MTKVIYNEGQLLGVDGIKFIRETEPIYYKDGRARRAAEFECTCGKLFRNTISTIKTGKVRSCGCLNDKMRIETGKKKRTHGLSKTPTYHSWMRMKMRCLNPNNKDFPEYGGRGVSVCAEWLNSFEAFLSDMGEKPEGMSLDRIDVNGDYCKENCRWTYAKVQAWNQRTYKSNKSGKLGVTWNNKGRKWEVRISKNGVEHFLGQFEDLEKAIEVRERAEVAFYGYVKNPFLGVRDKIDMRGEQ